MRGRLVFPFLADIAQLDTLATSLDPDGAGPLTSGYDDVFREPVKLADGTSARKEKAVVRLPCQVEVETYAQLQLRRAGNDPTSLLILVFHFQDLEDRGLVDPTTGDALLRVNDRLVQILRLKDETVVQHAGFRDGFYCTEVQPQSFGLTSGERNLLLAYFKTRDNTYAGAGA